MLDLDTILDPTADDLDAVEDFADEIAADDADALAAFLAEDDGEDDFLPGLDAFADDAEDEFDAWGGLFDDPESF